MNQHHATRFMSPADRPMPLQMAGASEAHPLEFADPLRRLRLCGPDSQAPMPSHTRLKPPGTTRRAFIGALLLCSSPLRSKAASAPPHPASEQDMKLQIRLDGQALDVHLDDNPTAHDLISLLPRRLSTAQAPRGHTPRAGDLTYYAPWGNLALFHKDFSFSTGLIRLGRIEIGMEYLARPGRLTSDWLMVAGKSDRANTL